MIGAPLDTVTLVHHAEAVAEVPRKRQGLLWLTHDRSKPRRARLEDLLGHRTSEGALPYERVLGEEDYIEHITLSALAARAGRSGAVGEAPAYLFDARGLVEHAVGWIERNFASGDLDRP